MMNESIVFNGRSVVGFALGQDDRPHAQLPRWSAPASAGADPGCLQWCCQQSGGFWWGSRCFSYYGDWIDQQCAPQCT